MAVSAKVERIIHEVESLSAEEREELMCALELAEDELSDEWREELQSRVRDMDEGRVRMIPHEEVLKSLHEDLRR